MFTVSSRAPRVCQLTKKEISFFHDLAITTGSRTDWPYFARWHYRSHSVGLSKLITILWHRDRPIGICVFVPAPLSLARRNEYFGLSGKWSRTALKSLNFHVVRLARIVLHPVYRGAGLASWFLKVSCQSAPWPYIETLAEMGHVHPLFEKAGFVRVGTGPSHKKSREGHTALYGGANKHRHTKRLSEETYTKSLKANPIYYLLDNRDHWQHSPIGRSPKVNERVLPHTPTPD